MLLSGRTSRQALAAVTSSGITILLNLLSLSLSLSAYVLGLSTLP
jgi:hypothetical protein